MPHHYQIAYRGIAQLVEQRSPNPRAEGSRPSAPARKPDLFRQVAFLVIFALRRVILLRGDICPQTSDIRFAGFRGGYFSARYILLQKMTVLCTLLNIAETVRFHYHFYEIKISLCKRNNITKYVVGRTYRSKIQRAPNLYSLSIKKSEKP